ncbi:MAG: gliding motility-associated C-terminal domain-containing protein [Cyclobacteriaceae bacterium]
MTNLYCTKSPSFKWKTLLLSGAMMFLSCQAFSQGLYNQASLHINGVTLYVGGDIHNDGLLVNEGHLAFTGDWESEGNYKGSGALDAQGHGTQRIFHFNQKVSDLLVNGWGTKYINGKINITGQFQLTAGIVHVSPEAVLRLKESALISGGSENSYVEGAITVEGIGYKFFPVGKNGTYVPLELLDVKGKLPEYSIEVFEKAPVISIENVIVRSDLYWERKDLGGDFGGSPLAIYYDPRNFQNPENMVILAGTDWEEPFMKITEVEHSAEARKLITLTNITAPIIMLGEISSQWREADFYLSTALSPNASNPDNRKVKIFGERLAGEQFLFVVFDRWGNVVYENTSLEYMAGNGWDGRSVTGDELVSGTYPFRLTAFDKTKKHFERKGVITIIY